MIVERERRGLKNMQQWSTGLKVFKWWMEDDNMDGQLAFDMEGGRFTRNTPKKMNMQSMRKKSKKKGDRCSGLPFSSLCQTLKT